MYFIFKGKGWGHSVGMCQWCAKNMADAGYSYRDILTFFYKNTYIGNLSNATSTFARGF